jgi:hypothetical protein
VNKVGKYTVSEIRPRIFFLQFKRNYDLCMQFLRYQEFYESPSSKFRGHQFELLDYMEWYAFQKGAGCFTYPRDWAGFNIPGDTIKKVWDLGISDRNLYDYEMQMLYRKFLEQYPDNKFYIIGACNTKVTMRHELAHGLFYTQPEYKKATTNLVKGLKKPFFKSMCSSLKEMGYTPKVYIDECQAYLSTGMVDSFKVKTKKEREPFIAAFNDYFNKR